MELIEQQEYFFKLMRGIHRELIINNWNTITQKKNQRKLFQLLDVVNNIDYVYSTDDRTKNEFIKDIAKLKSQGYVEA
jgi:heat shock protein HspQ